MWWLAVFTTKGDDWQENLKVNGFLFSLSPRGNHAADLLSGPWSPKRKVGLSSTLEVNFQESPGFWKFSEAPVVSWDKSGLLGQSGFRHPISMLLSPLLTPWLVGKRKTHPSKVKNLRMRAVCCFLNLWSSSYMILSFYFILFLFCYHCYVFWLLFLCGVKFDLYKERGSMRLYFFLIYVHSLYNLASVTWLPVLCRFLIYKTACQYQFCFICKTLTVSHFSYIIWPQ